MTIKTIIYSKVYKALCVTFLSGVFCTSCSDFFDTDPKSLINENDYISHEDEMYKGMLGIFNRMQEAGDHAIYLTDTRSNYLEVTENAPNALQDIYNYEPTDGNEYADPTCYYAIIVACNDYFHKMEEYHKNIGGMSETAEKHFMDMLSSAMRIKVWAYWTLGRIYGEAYWFDDPLTEMTNLTNTAVFTKCDMKMLADRCINLLDNGMQIDGMQIDANRIMKWYTWLDPENEDKALYVKWQYLTPVWELLRAELLSWRCSYQDEDAAQTDWLWIRDNLLKFISDVHNAPLNSSPVMAALNFSGDETESNINNFGVDWRYRQSALQMTMDFSSGIREQWYPYSEIFATEEIGNHMQVITGITYDYNNNQRNRLTQYFCPDYPCGEGYYLRPSAYGLGLYNSEDIRSIDQQIVVNNISGKPCVSKYYYEYDRTTRTHKYLREKIFEIEPTVLLFRAHDLHFLLAEAENHLGNWDQVRTILNIGMLERFPEHDIMTEMPEGWSPYYASWMLPIVSSWGNNTSTGICGNVNIGIVNAARGTRHYLPAPTDNGYNLTEAERKEIYDWAIADEHMKEFIAEGKSYPYLCKIAERYCHGGRGNEATARDSVANRIAPKYTTGRQKVRNSITANGYFIHWDLNH